MPEIGDLEQIINGCKKGDSNCFSQLIDAYSKRTYGFFYRLTGNKETSNDLLSELFVKLVEKIQSFKGGSFECWLFKIASNIFKDHLRTKQRQKRMLEARKEKLLLETENLRQLDSEIADELQLQVEKLDSDTKEVIMLRFYSQLSFKEIAQVREEPVGTTLSKLHRGLKKLRELMERKL